MAATEDVLLCEVGPRDGFQYEDRPIPTDLKVRLIRSLVAAGIRRIQIVSFVHPHRVPQMADAEQVVEQLGPPSAGVRFAGLALNRRGVERAVASGLREVDLSIATHDRHSLDNAGMTVEQAVAEAERMVDAAKGSGMRVQMGLQTVFGFRQPGDTPLDQVIKLCASFAAWDVDEISLGDTTGMANPVLIEDYVQGIRREIGEIPLVLHLHDTRGLGLANVMAGLMVGVRRFDSAFGGLGGCPFIRGAAGNVATEDAAYLLDTLGYVTGIDVRAVSACAQEMADFLAHPLPGKLHRVFAAA